MYNLKKYFLLISVLALIFCTSDLSNAQSMKSNQANTLTQSTKLDNSVDYQSVATFKTISRKNEYRIGELISIDVAILNKSKEPIYFLDLKNWGRISVLDSANKEIAIRGGIFPLIAPSFKLLGSGEYDSSYFIYLIGCDDMYKHYNYDWKSMEDDFNKSRFANIGYRCIDTKKPGKYVINAKISNDFAENDNTNKTAVGTIESTSFEITIIDDSKK